MNGEYNGRLRDIEFENIYATTFTGIYSNFAGNTDIYNGTSIKDIKVYDISQENFKSLNDIGKIENVYNEVNKSSNGKYGVYELDESTIGADFKIYCPDNKKKVVCIEYTITDAVVVHNDVAELYWNVLGEYFEESINDFQVLIHLPGEDKDVRIWTHGPLTGENKIIDSKTLFFKDINIDKYTPETIRIMFDKDLVPYATKCSGVDGRENILKYEKMMADTANSERENAKLELENRASQAVLDLEKSPRMYYYNRALELVNQLDEKSEEKQNFLNRIAKTKNAVKKDWIEDLDYEVESLTDYNYSLLSRDRLDDFKEKIEEGFDEEVKEEYLSIYEKLEGLLEIKEAGIRRGFTIFVICINSVLGIFVVYKIIKIIKERYKFKEQYYRDFPTEDNPNVLEYLMKKKSTALGFSSTVLNLINKKVISYEKNSNNDDIVLKLLNEDYKGSDAENAVLDVLFKLVGQYGKCNIKDLKNYGKSKSGARSLINKIDKFKKSTKKEVEYKSYFEDNKLSTVYIILVIIVYVLSLFMAFGVFYGLEGSGLRVLEYLLGISIINIFYAIIWHKDKNRTNKGKEAYSKWLAHKRFLMDFSNFDEKDLPDITLWDKYLVTATVLGCADKVEKRMKMYITDPSQIDTDLLIYRNLNMGLTRELNKSIQKAISNSSSSISSSSYSSGYSSGGGFGGGSSGGGGRRRPEAVVAVASNLYFDILKVGKIRSLNRRNNILLFKLLLN